MKTELTQGQKTHGDGYAVISRCRRENMGFLNETDVAMIANDPATRLTLLLVRCGGGRFLAPADQVMHFVDIIEQHAEMHRANGVKVAASGACTRDYIRDISLPAGDRL